MKKRISVKHRIALLLVPLVAAFLLGGVFALRKEAAFAAEGSITAEEQTAGKKFAGSDYLELYALPTSAFSYSNNGGGDLSKAFDGDFSTQWTSEAQNSRTDKGASADFFNEVTVTFHAPVEIDRILYQASSARVAHGYPQELEIFVSAAGEAEHSLGLCNSTPTVNRVVFGFGAQTVKTLRFVFKQPNTSHNWVAAAKEILFLTPDDPDLDKIVSLFDDYAQTQVNSSVTEEYLASARQKFSSRLNYQTAIAPLLDRAEGFKKGTLQKESAREYGTGATGANRIERYGAVRTYCADVLKFSTFGVDYQPTGIAAAAGSKLTVYVDGEEGDPLPSLVCTQTFGDWRSWLTRFPLVRGKNVIVFPDFIAARPEAYTVGPGQGLRSGGPVYLENPYAPAAQSKNVKVYIEGGVFYPVYRKGGDEAQFRAAVQTYTEKMREEPEVYPDVAEIVSDHVLATSLATSAGALYGDGENSVRASCEGWDGYMRALLSFGGVSFDPASAHYEEINAHLRHNVRLAQPWGGALAYASGGFCGFCSDKYTDGFHLLRFGVYGWAMAHELGHALDNNMGAAGRTTAEVTNNMWAIYDRIAVEKSDSARYDAEVFRSLLSPDAVPAVKAYEQYRGTGYVFWWLIESRYPGFWGEMENMYRYRSVEEDMAAAGVTEEEKKGLTQEERHAYLCSLAAQTDLTYYFDRWGFYFATKKVGEGDEAKEAPATQFAAEGLSAAYNKLMAAARARNAFPRPALKFWYGDYDNYTYVSGGGQGMYTAESKAAILDVFSSESGHTLFLPEREEAAHLGYEISEGDRVIGFTGGSMFTDASVYPAGYMPVYRVRAYDRLFNASALSAPVSPAAASETVCRIGEVSYSSLASAVEAAEDGAIIEVISTARTAAVEISKNLVISGDRTVMRGAAGHLFTVKKGGSLTLRGGSGEREALRIDGGNILQNGALIRIEAGGAFRTEGCVILENNRSTGDGGAISASCGLELTSAVLRGNAAKNGGAVFLDGVYTTLFTDVRFDKNTASENGGAIRQRGSATFAGCIFVANAAKNGGAVSNHSGGIVTFNDCRLERNIAAETGGGVSTDGAVNFNGSDVVGNRAASGGGVYFGSSVAARRAVLSSSSAPLKFKSNAAVKGGAMYVCSAAPVTVNAVAFVGNRAEEQNGGGALYVEKGAPVLPDTPEQVPDFVFGGWLVNGKSAASLAGLKAGDFVDALGEVSFYVSYFVDDEPYGETALWKDGATVSLSQFTGQTEKRRFMGWDVNGEMHAAGDVIVLTEDLTANAVFKNEYGATVTVDGVVLQKKTVLEDEAFVLPEAPEPPKGKIFKGWQVHGTVRAPGDEIYLTADTEIFAVFEDEEGGLSTALIVCVCLGSVAVLGMAATVLGIVLHRRKKLGK